MPKLFQSIMSAGRKRRNMAVAFALWLLRQARDAEKDELQRHEDRLDRLALEPAGVSRREYAAIEDECSDCEHALGVLEGAIEDLVIEYCAGRF